MYNYTCLVAGVVILAIVYFDFFYTTLSGSGFTFLTRTCASVTHKIILLVAKVTGRKLLSISGMLVNLVILAMWILLVWAGLFLVYSFHPSGILNSNNEVATSIQRLYMSGYVLSTLGMGDVKPVTPFFEVITSFFSFFGFAFFTTSMTYLLSVSSAVIQKRSLALSIRNFGKNPLQTVNSLMYMDNNLRCYQLSNLQSMINRHSNFYQAYPVLHYYHHIGVDASLAVNVAVLDEALSIIMHSKGSSELGREVGSLRAALDDLLEHLKNRFEEETDYTPDINWASFDLPQGLAGNGFSTGDNLKQRRRVLGGLLRNEGRTWGEVYQ